MQMTLRFRRKQGMIKRLIEVGKCYGMEVNVEKQRK
jgi:hypothetical protein